MALKEYAYWGFGIESPSENPYVREMLEAVARGKGRRRPEAGEREKVEVRELPAVVQAAPCLSVLVGIARQWRCSRRFFPVEFKLNTG